MYAGTPAVTLKLANRWKGSKKTEQKPCDLHPMIFTVDANFRAHTNPMLLAMLLRLPTSFYCMCPPPKKH